jgi:hypothetical protein
LTHGQCGNDGVVGLSQMAGRQIVDQLAPALIALRTAMSRW